MIGRRRVFWEIRKGGVSKCRGDSREAEWESITDTSKALKWVPKGIKQAAVKPNLGLGTSPVMSDPSMGPFNPVFSGPSMFEVGEGSLAGEGDSAQASVTFVDKFGASTRCAMPLVEADAPFLVGSSSDEPTLP